MKTNKAVEYKIQGNDYFKEGNYDKALEYYGKSIEIDPKYRDAWNNIYVTLLKMERTDDAKKCKEILDGLEYKPETPLKRVADRPYKRLKQVLAIIIVILLALSIIMAALSILGWVSYRAVIPVAPEQYVSDMMNTTISGFINLVNPT
jgi:tetratricopeptide (TPR) repeat protein